MRLTSKQFGRAAGWLYGRIRQAQSALDQYKKYLDSLTHGAERDDELEECGEFPYGALWASAFGLIAQLKLAAYDTERAQARIFAMAFPEREDTE